MVPGAGMKPVASPVAWIWVGFVSLIISKSNFPILNPNGIPSFSPRLRQRRYLGFKTIHLHNPNAGCGCFLAERISMALLFLQTQMVLVKRIIVSLSTQPFKFMRASSAKWSK